MWLEYNRILEGNQWIHPDFALDGRTQEKYLSPTDNTLFLANTTVEDFTDIFIDKEVITENKIEVVDNNGETQEVTENITTIEKINTTNYGKFNIVVIPNENLKTVKNIFKITAPITKYAFLERFTEEENAKIFNYAIFIDMLPITTQEKFSRKITMGTIMGKLSLAEKINLNDETTKNNYYKSFLSVGLISEERLKEVLEIV